MRTSGLSVASSKSRCIRFIRYHFGLRNIDNEMNMINMYDASIYFEHITGYYWIQPRLYTYHEFKPNISEE